MNSIEPLPSLYSMNQANNSTRPEDDRLAIDEDSNRLEIQQNHQQHYYQQSQHAFLSIPGPPTMHIRTHSDTFSDIDSDDLRAFPLKLHACLDDAESKGFDHIISWQSDELFKIRDAEAFEEHIMPQYFRSQSKYKSFQRQLNLYEFERIPKGPYKGSYRHPFFKRGQHEISNRMRLRKIKGRNSGGSPKAKKREVQEATPNPPPPAVPAPPEPSSPSSSSQPPTLRPSASGSSAFGPRPKNRPTSECTFEGRTFFPV